MKKSVVPDTALEMLDLSNPKKRQLAPLNKADSSPEIAPKKPSAKGCKEGYSRQSVVLPNSLIRTLKQESLNREESISLLIETALIERYSDPLNRLTI